MPSNLTCAVCDRLKHKRRCSKRTPSPESGFTLVELIVVAVLLGLMSVILYGTLNGIIRVKRTIDSSRTAHRTAEHLIAQISRELASMSSEPLNKREDGKSTQLTSPLPGSSSSGASGKVYMIGRRYKLGNQEVTSLRFVSTTGAQASLAGKANYGNVEIEYRLEEGSADTASVKDTVGTPRSPMLGDEKSLLLMREETPASVTDIDIVNAHRVLFPLADNVVALNFRFLKDNKWQEEWQGQNPNFPQAIEISLKLQDESGRLLSFKTAVAVPQLGLQF